MWLSTLEIVTEQLLPVKEIATTGENTVLMCEQSLYPVWFSRLRKSYPLQCEHNLIEMSFSMFHALGSDDVLDVEEIISLRYVLRQP